MLRHALLLSAAGLLIAIALPAAAQQKQAWKLSDVHPLGYSTVEAVERTGKKLEKASNGRISIQMFPSMQLGGEPADLKGMKIRMMGSPLFVETMNAMGGNGVAMGFNELCDHSGRRAHALRDEQPDGMV
jgi:TRAP-type C4-dicarboxylate transport system substrate-binding protein